MLKTLFKIYVLLLTTRNFSPSESHTAARVAAVATRAPGRGVTCAFVRNVDYPGNDIMDVTNASLTPTACCDMCRKEPTCGMWVLTAVAPGAPRCWLKTTHGEPMSMPAGDGIVSMNATAAAGGRSNCTPIVSRLPRGNVGVDRPGGDLAGFDPAPGVLFPNCSGGSAPCADACNRTKDCVAWSWRVLGCLGA